MDKSEGRRPPENQRGYKKLVEEIKDLKWENLEAQDLQRLMYLSCVSAREFADALTTALALYPDNKDLQKMATGELRTDNIALDDYKKKGDHADFLEHFIRKNGLDSDTNLVEHAEAYLKACEALDPQTRAMTIFSREEELSGIFKRILTAKDWSAPGLEAFKFYLEKHIKLDSEKGGHHDLTKELPIDERITPFYEARLKMYEAIPKLFEK